MASIPGTNPPQAPGYRPTRQRDLLPNTSSRTRPASQQAELLEISDLPIELLALIFRMTLTSGNLPPTEEKDGKLVRRNFLALREVCRPFRQAAGMVLQAEWAAVQQFAARMLNISQRMDPKEFPEVPQYLLCTNAEGNPIHDREETLLSMSGFKELAAHPRMALAKREIPLEEWDIIAFTLREKNAIETKALEQLGVALRKKFSDKCLAETPQQVYDWCLNPKNQKSLATATTLEITYAQILDLPIEVSSLLIGKKQAIEDRSLDVLCSQITVQYPGIVFPMNPEERRDWFLLPENEEVLEQVSTLNLTDQQLESLPKEIGKLSALEEIYLLNNNLTTLPGEIGNLRVLEILDLWKNNLTTLPKEIGNLSNLERLELDENKLTILPKEIGNLTALKALDLEDNKLTTLPKEIGNLIALQKLNLGYNKLETLPAEIAQSPNRVIRKNEAIRECFKKMVEAASPYKPKFSLGKLYDGLANKKKGVVTKNFNKLSKDDQKAIRKKMEEIKGKEKGWVKKHGLDDKHRGDLQKAVKKVILDQYGTVRSTNKEKKAQIKKKLNGRKAENHLSLVADLLKKA